MLKINRYIVEQIKSLVPIKTVIEKCMGKTVINNKICCPFHNEKTASLTVYPNNTFYCFGCGASGDVINFIQLYFNIQFKEAVTRLDYEYNLGLLKPCSYSKYLIQIEKSKKIISERQNNFKKSQLINNKYWRAFDAVRYYTLAINLLCPKGPDAIPSPEFITALSNIEYANYLLDCAENDRIKMNIKGEFK